MTTANRPLSSPAFFCSRKEAGNRNSQIQWQNKILSNSPTQTVSYKAVSSLEKVWHRIPLLSLDKTKMVSELVSFVKDHAALLMLKLDSLTVKLVYKDGKLASGSIRCLDAGICREREISFFVFNVLEGMAEFGDIKDSRSALLLSMIDHGFGVCPFVMIPPGASAEDIEQKVQTLKDLAEISDIPIDGMVLRYDSLSYSASLSRTGRSGEIAPVAIDKVEIDGCEVSRAMEM